jgi:hypothetical protein
VEAAVEEVQDVLGVQPLGLGVGVGDRDDLRERGRYGESSLPRAATRSQYPSSSFLPAMYPPKDRYE